MLCERYFILSVLKANRKVRIFFPRARGGFCVEQFLSNCCRSCFPVVFFS
jgi:hypothetical protein